MIRKKGNYAHVFAAIIRKTRPGFLQTAFADVVIQSGLVYFSDAEFAVKLDFNAVAQFDFPASEVFRDFHDSLFGMESAYMVGDFSRYQCGWHGSINC